MTPQQVRQAINQIEGTLEPLLAGLPKTKRDQEIVERISALVGREPPWSRTIYHLVRAGHKPPSPAFGSAVLAFAYSLDGVHPLRAQATPVEVLAVGDVLPGALVLSDSRRCESPTCAVPFVPRVPWQRFCSRDCQLAAYRMRTNGGVK